MKAGRLEIVRGTGNVFRDTGSPNADLQQLKALLGARILLTLDERELTVRAAEELTQIAAADFSRIRNANLSRFTVDRLMTILSRLGKRVDVEVRVRPRAKSSVARAKSRPAISRFPAAT